jgi:CBS domain-containing protein
MDNTQAESILDSPVELSIETLMDRSGVTIRAEDPVARAEALLNGHHLTSIPVMGSNDAIIGMISSQELLTFNAEHRNPNAVRVWEICRVVHFEASADTPVSELAKLMLDQRIEHIAVTEDGVLHGVVAAIDLYAALAARV